MENPLQPNPRPRRTIGFLTLAPSTRNTIYEMLYHYHKRTARSLTISSEKGPREIPAALSRTCRQIRFETLPYFFELDLIIFTLRDRADLRACREWVGFVPEKAWELVKGVRIKQTHCLDEQKRCRCQVNFELDLNNVENPVSGPRRWPGGLGCKLCDASDRATIDLILKDMCAGGKVTPSGLELIFDILGRATVD